MPDVSYGQRIRQRESIILLDIIRWNHKLHVTPCGMCGVGAVVGKRQLDCSLSFFGNT